MNLSRHAREGFCVYSKRGAGQIATLLFAINWADLEVIPMPTPTECEPAEYLRPQCAAVVLFTPAP